MNTTLDTAALTHFSHLFRRFLPDIHYSSRTKRKVILAATLLVVADIISSKKAKINTKSGMEAAGE